MLLGKGFKSESTAFVENTQSIKVVMIELEQSFTFRSVIRLSSSSEIEADISPFDLWDMKSLVARIMSHSVSCGPTFICITEKFKL